MDFMRILKSLEEFLYEVISWLVFYPYTLFLSIFRPARMMEYARLELADSAEEQYDDTLSPPLFLLISLFLAHLIEVRTESAEIIRQNAFLAQERNLLGLRAIMFSLFPLIFSLGLLRRQKHKLSRQSLRAPFYAQCYVATCFVLAISVSGTLFALAVPWSRMAAMLLLTVALGWYAVVQTRWFHRYLDVSAPRAAGIALITFGEACLAFLCVAILVGFALQSAR